MSSRLKPDAAAHERHISASHIPRKPLYTARDIESLPHLHSLPGEAPYLRGPYQSMYTQKPWTIRQYTGMASAVATNLLFRASLSQGAQGLSVAFDLPTHRGLDSDHPDAIADIGMAGVAIDSVEDMKQLFAGIDLSQVSVSMTMNGAVLPILACFIVAAEESGVDHAQLSGTIQNDILKEFIVRNTYIFSPEESLNISTDVVEYITAHIPRFNAMSVSGYHFQEGGADPVLALALTLADAEIYAATLIARGMSADEVCSKLSFFFGVGSDFYLEIAKLRAARLLWCDIAQRLGATTDKARALRMHCQTSGWSLLAQDSANNTVRTTMQAMSAVFGGVQSLHTNAYDEALSLPTPASSRLARNTQLIMQLETGICDVIDPWAGSYMMESMTAEVVDKVKVLLDEIARQGGIIAAIESGWANNLLQAGAIETQAMLERGERKVVGLNTHLNIHLAQEAPAQTAPAVDYASVKEQQLSSLQALKSSRDQVAHKRALNELKEIARSRQGNLLQATINAIRARATIGECTAALATVWPMHKAQPGFTDQEFGKGMAGHEEWEQACFRSRSLARKLDRRPRILMGKLGQDGHDRGIKVIAGALADAGFDVDLTPLFISPEEMVSRVLESKCDVLGISLLGGSHMQTVPRLMQGLAQAGVHIPVLLGGVIPEHDMASLKSMGIADIFLPGALLADIVRNICGHIEACSQAIS